MAKNYEGNVSVYLNTKNRLVLEEDPSGEFSNDNVEKLHKTMLSLAKKHSADIKLFKPDPTGTTLTIKAGYGGKPYLAMLPETASGGRRKPVKLA